MAPQPVENGAGDHGVAEDLAPGTETLIAGDDERTALLAARDQLEEEISVLAINRQISRSRRRSAAAGGSGVQPLVELPSANALPSVVISAVAVTNNVRTPCSQALTKRDR